MQYNPYLRILMKFISILLTLILIIIGIAIIAAAKLAEKKIEEEFGEKIDCNFITFDKDIAEKDASKKETLMSPTVQCYCMSQLIKSVFDS